MSTCTLSYMPTPHHPLQHDAIHDAINKGNNVLLSINDKFSLLWNIQSILDAFCSKRNPNSCFISVIQNGSFELTY